MRRNFIQIYFLLIFYKFAPSEQTCLYTQKDSQLCYICSAEFFPESANINQSPWPINFPASQCQKKSTVPMSFDFYVVGSLASINPSENVFKTLLSALKEIFKQAQGNLNANFTIHLSNTKHFILPQEIQVTQLDILRRTPVDLRIQPLSTYSSKTSFLKRPFT